MDSPRPDLEELRRLVQEGGIRQKPWELYETEGSFTYSIFGRHPGEDYDEDENLPCRITTGGDFDDLESARLAVAAVNALPFLLDELARLQSTDPSLSPDQEPRA